MKKLIFYALSLLVVIILYAGAVSPTLSNLGYLREIPATGGANDLISKNSCEPGTDTAFRTNLIGAASIGFQLAAPWLRPWRCSWGATAQEMKLNLPGDILVNDPRWSYTRAITIAAPRTEVWPWLVQIGQNRGGSYSYAGLENLIGCEIHNADTIIAEFQNLEVGTEIYLHPETPPLPVVAMQPGHWFILYANGIIDDADDVENLTTDLTWAFYLMEIDAQHTRMLVRGRYKYGDRLAERLSYGPMLVEPLAFVMERRMLRGIKYRAENSPVR
ncbi:MAG: hypothetical protein ABIA75_06410 [Candidatus Neomarinimicrobiota bacterium]